jgi:hypothetical protein
LLGQQSKMLLVVETKIMDHFLIDLYGSNTFSFAGLIAEYRISGYNITTQIEKADL